MLVGMPVGDKSPAPLLLGEVIDQGRLDQGVGQYPGPRPANSMSAPSNATGFGEVGPIVFFDGVGRRAEISNPPGDADGKAHIY
jgi:hypothetical protein